MTRAAIAIGCCLSIGAAASWAGQQPRFKASVTGVVLDVAVLDDSAIVRGLAAKNFEVWDNGVRQAVTVQETTNMPLDVMAVVQPLASMRPSAVALVQREGLRLFELVQANDRLGVIIASVPPTLDRRLLAPSAGTSAVGRWTGTLDVSLWDALFAAYQQFDRPERRRVTILFTNSDNDAGVVGPREVAAAAELRAAQLFVLLVDQTGPDPTRYVVRTERGRSSLTRNSVALKWGVPGALIDLVEATGGRVFDLRDGEANVAELLGYLRAEYLITYTPTGVPRAGWHDVDVRLKGRKGTVITRPGYWAAAGGALRH